jgi:hypothetical protein
VSSIWFLSSTRVVGILRRGKTASSCRLVAALSTRQQLDCPSAAALFDQLLPQQGAIQFCMLPSVPAISSRINHLPCFGRLVSRPTLALSLCVFPHLCWVLVALLGGWFVTPLPLSAFIPLPISAGCQQLLWEVGLSSCSHSQTLLLSLHWISESSALGVWLLTPPPFSRAGSVFKPHLHYQC